MTPTTEPVIGVRRLAVAVLTLAMTEAAYVGTEVRELRRRTAARRWVSDAGAGFRWWCDVANVDPVALRRSVLDGSARPPARMTYSRSAA